MIDDPLVFKKLVEELSRFDPDFLITYVNHTDVNDGISPCVLMGELFDVFCAIEQQSVTNQVLSIIGDYYSKGGVTFRNAVDVSFLEGYVIQNRTIDRLPDSLAEPAGRILAAIETE